MHRGSKYVIAIALLLALSPSAIAEWKSYGEYEPNTPYDDSTWMPQEPSHGGKVLYFNAITYEQVPETGVFVNPNVAEVHSRNEVANAEFHMAILGVWTDCNGDGYIGMAETAVREYKSNLLLDTTICPPATGFSSGGPGGWNGQNNYNGWVSELIPIARNATPHDVRVYRDDQSMVWGDYGTPDQHPTHLSCTLQPFPHGTWKDVGGVLSYEDCRSRTQGIDTLATANTVFDAAGQSQEDFTDAAHHDAHSGPIGRISIFGSDDSHKAAAKAFDCSQPAIVNVGDITNNTAPTAPVNGSVQDIRIWAPGPAVGDTSDPTIPGQYNETREETEFGSQGCNTSNDPGNDFYGGVMDESQSFNGIDPNNKHESDWNFGFIQNDRGVAGPPTALGAGPAGADNDAGIDGNSPGGGVSLIPSVGSPPTFGSGGSYWAPSSVWLTKTGFGVVKADLGTGQVGLADAYWLSFYVHVGSATTSKGIQLPGGIGTYGNTQCGSFTSGIHMGWNCDKAIWNTNADGSPYDESAFKLARVGQQYELRDVDCYDGSNDQGLPLEPAALGTNPCP